MVFKHSKRTSRRSKAENLHDLLKRGLNGWLIVEIVATSIFKCPKSLLSQFQTSIISFLLTNISTLISSGRIFRLAIF